MKLWFELHPPERDDDRFDGLDDLDGAELYAVSDEP
jgi:hypothetical protein